MNGVERQMETGIRKTIHELCRCLQEQGCVSGLDAPLVGQRRPEATGHMHGLYQVLHKTRGAAEALNAGAHLHPPTKLTRFG